MLPLYHIFPHFSTVMTIFAQRVILGKTAFEDVPAKLKAKVADILVNECGLPELVPEEFRGETSRA